MPESPGREQIEGSRFLTYDEIRNLISTRLLSPKKPLYPIDFALNLAFFRSEKAKYASHQIEWHREKWEKTLKNLRGLANGIDYEQIRDSLYPEWRDDDFKELLRELGEDDTDL